MNETLSGLIILAVILGAFGPMVSAMVLTFRNNGFTSLKQYFTNCLRLNTSIKTYIIAIIISLGITALVHYSLILSKQVTLPTTLFPSEIEFPLIIVIIPYTLMLFTLGGGQEEFGWRGFIHNPLSDKLGAIKASLLIGFFWGLWHLPLWFIEGEGHQYYSFFAFMIYIVSWSLTLGIMYEVSGRKMIIPWIMHSFANLSVPLFPILILDFVEQPAYWIWAFTNMLFSILLSIWFISRDKSKYRNKVAFK